VENKISNAKLDRVTSMPTISADYTKKAYDGMIARPPPPPHTHTLCVNDITRKLRERSHSILKGSS